ncbi:putative FAD binding oxidoreductase, partial [Hyaloscypha variabilis F]
GAVIFPLTTQDVSNILGFAHAKHLELAVCGAGHNHRGNSLDHGLIIDLRKMTGVSVNPLSKRVTTDGATVWGSVYEATERHGLAVVGGLIPSVGVGGFTLNGGIGWLTSAHGVALDNLLEADVVLADGRVLTCSEMENEDLFWAIRGAGSAFGVVTRFVFQAHEINSKVWSGMMRFESDCLSGVVDMVNKIASEENDGTASIAFGIFAQGGKLEIGVLVFYNGPEDEAKNYFAPLLEMPRKFDVAGMVPFSQATMPHGSAPGRQWRKVTAGGCLIVPLDHSFIQSLKDDLEDLITRIPDSWETIIACEMHNPFATMKKGQTSTAFPFRGRHGSVQLMPTWTLEENDEACWAWCRKMDAKLAKEFARRKNEEGIDETTKTSSGTYINYDGLHKSPRTLYGVNYERLVELKKKYDPGNVFKLFVDLLSEE